MVVAVGFSNSTTGSIINSGVRSSSLPPHEASVSIVSRIKANLSCFIPMFDFVIINTSSIVEIGSVLYMTNEK